MELSFQPPVELSFQPPVEVQSGTWFQTHMEPPIWNPPCGSSLELSKPSEKLCPHPCGTPPVEVQSGTRFQTHMEPPLWKFNRVPGSNPLWNLASKPLWNCILVAKIDTDDFALLPPPRRGSARRIVSLFWML